MSTLLQKALDQVLALNQRVASTAVNGFDWLFRKENLIKSGKTWFDTIHVGDLMQVRYYDLHDEKSIPLPDGTEMPVAAERVPIPLVLVPPLGVTANTFDLMPNRSLARYMAARGFRTYLIDWGKPKPEHGDLRLKDYAEDMMAEALDKIRAHSGSEELSLMGWCMGGLLCLIHAGLVHDPRLRNIVTVASPIDTRAGGLMSGVAVALDAPARLVRRFTDWRLEHVDPVKVTPPGWVVATVFKMTDPIGSVTTYWDLLTRLWDREFVESHTTTSDYLNRMLRYPGGVLQDLVVHVAADNRLAQGKIQIGDRISEIDRIDASMLVYAGATDHIVTPPIARKLVDVVASNDKQYCLVRGGHMGVILGSQAIDDVWAPTADWLAARSEPRRRLAAPAKRRGKAAAAVAAAAAAVPAASIGPAARSRRRTVKTDGPAGKTVAPARSSEVKTPTAGRSEGAAGKKKGGEALPAATRVTKRAAPAAGKAAKVEKPARAEKPVKVEKPVKAGSPAKVKKPAKAEDAVKAKTVVETGSGAAQLEATATPPAKRRTRSPAKANAPTA